MSSPVSPRQVEIVPSVLPADFAHLGDACVELEKAGIDRIQWDVMDGNFVPNLTFGADTIAAIRPLVSVPFEAHLMVHEPTWILDTMVDAGCGMLIVHAEACQHLHRTLGRIRELGVRAAVALNPATPVEAVVNVLDLVDMVLVMTVNPGFGGQTYISTMEPKVTRLRGLIVEAELDVDVEVDGGISPSTIAGASRAGANVFIAGSSLFGDPQGFAHATQELRALATDAAG
jgi:ribulose-phosphate 3-epimerase